MSPDAHRPTPMTQQMEDTLDLYAQDRHRCFFCRPDPTVEKAARLHFTNLNLLHDFVNARGMIRSRRYTNLCHKHQQRLRYAIKNARRMALMSYTTNWKAPVSYLLPDHNGRKLYDNYANLDFNNRVELAEQDGDIDRWPKMPPGRLGPDASVAPPPTRSELEAYGVGYALNEENVWGDPEKLTAAQRVKYEEWRKEEEKRMLEAVERGEDPDGRVHPHVLDSEWGGFTPSRLPEVDLEDPEVLDQLLKDMKDLPRHPDGTLDREHISDDMLAHALAKVLESAQHSVQSSAVSTEQVSAATKAETSALAARRDRARKLAQGMEDSSSDDNSAAEDLAEAAADTADLLRRGLRSTLDAADGSNVTKLETGEIAEITSRVHEGAKPKVDTTPIESLTPEQRARADRDREILSQRQEGKAGGMTAMGAVDGSKEDNDEATERLVHEQYRVLERSKYDPLYKRRAELTAEYYTSSGASSDDVTDMLGGQVWYDKDPVPVRSGDVPAPLEDIHMPLAVRRRMTSLAEAGLLPSEDFSDLERTEAAIEDWETKRAQRKAGLSRGAKSEGEGVEEVDDVVDEEERKRLLLEEQLDEAALVAADAEEQLAMGHRVSADARRAELEAYRRLKAKEARDQYEQSRHENMVEEEAGAGREGVTTRGGTEIDPRTLQEARRLLQERFSRPTLAEYSGEDADAELALAGEDGDRIQNADLDNTDDDMAAIGELSEEEASLPSPFGEASNLPEVIARGSRFSDLGDAINLLGGWHWLSELGVPEYQIKKGTSWTILDQALEVFSRRGEVLEDEMHKSDPNYKPKVSPEEVTKTRFVGKDPEPVLQSMRTKLAAVEEELKTFEADVPAFEAAVKEYQEAVAKSGVNEMPIDKSTPETLRASRTARMEKLAQVPVPEVLKGRMLDRGDILFKATLLRMAVAKLELLKARYDARVGRYEERQRNPPVINVEDQLRLVEELRVHRDRVMQGHVQFNSLGTERFMTDGYLNNLKSLFVWYADEQRRLTTGATTNGGPARFPDEYERVKSKVIEWTKAHSREEIKRLYAEAAAELKEQTERRKKGQDILRRISEYRKIVGDRLDPDQVNKLKKWQQENSVNDVFLNVGEADELSFQKDHLSQPKTNGNDNNNNNNNKE